MPDASPGSTGKLDPTGAGADPKRKAGGIELTQIIGNLLAAIDPDRIRGKGAREIEPVAGDSEPIASSIAIKAREQLAGDAASRLQR